MDCADLGVSLLDPPQMVDEAFVQACRAARSRLNDFHTTLSSLLESISFQQLKYLNQIASLSEEAESDVAGSALDSVRDAASSSRSRRMASDEIAAQHVAY
eukprot:GABV01013843.1.p1 GENE.GABV01013843.1~~GABV01013843.1.p1  ORF type:complete len:101 (-),score=40.61 GABV01013843.1:11-313(-)